MPLFDRFPLRLARRRRKRGPAAPRGPLRRHPVLTSLPVLVVVAALLVWWSPWHTPPLCGRGLTAVGTPYVCVGLDLDSTKLRDDDPLDDLEKKIAKQNKKITARAFVTIVVLDDMTPDPKNDSLAFQNVRHGVQGALTGAWRANNKQIAGGTIPPVKLLLASFGSGGRFEREAVNAIVRARDSQHIVAVTGFGQSLDTSRKAASDLSDHEILTVGALISGDNMNRNPETDQYIQRFFRVTPTNTDAAAAAVAYLARQPYKKVMLVHDTNRQDLYAETLTKAFQTKYNVQYPNKRLYTKPYKSPETQLNGITRMEDMKQQFAYMHGDICQEQPDLIYFAGRGADLRSFLTALAEGGACELPSVDVMSSDDANNILGTPLPNFAGIQVKKVFYTGVATKDEWQKAESPQPTNMRNYTTFVSDFTGQRFGTSADLVDGYVMTNHDAVLTAATAARHVSLPVVNPKLTADSMVYFDCQHPIPGASGEIAFSQDSHGNPIDRPEPIIQIQPDGSPKLLDLTWATGQPFDDSAAACH